MNSVLQAEKDTPSAPNDHLDGLYIPERLTPLAFTEIYSEFSASERLRYNQLCGLYFLEQTIFFEQCMGRPVLERIMQFAPTPLREMAMQFLQEENEHTSWFWDLLKRCEPRRYRKAHFHFVKTSYLTRVALAFCTKRPNWFPCLLWLFLIVEERSQYFSGLFVRESDRLDARFAEVQRRHLADEADHIHWDVEFIECLWPATPLILRRLNARLLRWVLGEFFLLPKRSGWNVIEQWLEEFPALEARRAGLRRAMRSLATNRQFLHAMYPRVMFPRTQRLATRWSEMAMLEKFFSGN